ncbi:ribosome production factor 2 homolog [Pomacea canaliculata]|uniref:ribosome production factor 2 homolog n=1 Tax=Pomacea canaliculata TaxID=400727 RepID=UPI000D73F3C9|nr:ribosome production factor 2 homolog [Pomacea canaliculata]XP_025097498.1 ribosome production factor 2 homolog [Pomacea canaliculata]
MGLQRIVQPKTQRGKRALEHKEPKIHENIKTSLLLKGGNTSLLVTQVLKELHMLKKPHSVLFKKKNITRPFEDQNSLEFFSTKADASLFAFGCHSKKRPNNLIIGRMFDGHVLDMVEFGIEKFVSMLEFKGEKCVFGVKPCLVFSGQAFEQDSEYQRIRNLFTDFFKGPVVDNVRLAGLEHVISVTASGRKFYIRNYRILLKKSGSRTPRVELEDMGPSLDLVMRRTKLASDDLFRRALKQPKTAKPRKIKNISHDAFGSKLGRIHMTKQDLSKLQTRKMKGLKKRPFESSGEAAETSGTETTSPVAKKAKQTAT